MVCLPCVLIGRRLASKSVILCLYFCASLPVGIGDFCHFSESWWDLISFCTFLLCPADLFAGTARMCHVVGATEQASVVPDMIYKDYSLDCSCSS